MYSLDSDDHGVLDLLIVYTHFGGPTFAVNISVWWLGILQGYIDELKETKKKERKTSLNGLNGLNGL